MLAGAVFGAELAGLVLEIVWLRQLALVLGANTHALSIVLAAYMAGIALGNVWFGQRPES